jgi:predicted alpha/beta superfamily hydrolase
MACVVAGIAFGLSLFSGAAAPAFAQQPQKVELPGSELHTITARNGMKYEIYVAFPLQYDPKSAEKYPVLYLVDGRGLFPMVSVQEQLLSLEQEIKPMILVGIDVSAPNLIEGSSQRFTNLPPTRDLKREKELKEAYGKEIVTGKGERFRQDIVDEIIPWVEAHYPVTKERGLAGYSLGGLFTLHAMFASPGTFSTYLVGDPSLYWDDKVTLKTEMEFSKKNKSLPAHVFMGFTEKGHGEHVGTVLTFMEALEDHSYEGLKFEQQLFLDETHLSGMGAVFARGLTVLYGQK